MTELEIRQPGIEAKVENIEKELLFIKLALSKQKKGKVELNGLVKKISSKAKLMETTSLIREMREKEYA